MTRARRLASAALVLASAAVAAACRSSPRPAAQGPIVVYLVDALRPDRTSLYGADRATTPAAEALARESVTYTSAFALSTWTRPSVATLLTSLLPARAGALNRWGRLDASAWYLPQALREAGWATAAFVANANLFDERLGFQRGIDVFRPVVHGPTGEWHATAREVVEPALAYIESRTSPRFFLYVHVVDPHARWFAPDEEPGEPYLLEPRSRAMFAQAPGPEDGVPLDYDRSVRQADDQFARIAGALRGRGFWESATVVYTADHGEAFGEHGAVAHGHALDEEQVRVPLVIKYPDGDGAGARRSDPVSLADVTPTLAEVAALGDSNDWIGASLWRRRLPPEREIYHSEDLDEHRLYALRRGDSKLVVRLYPRFARTRFDLARDPRELAGLDLPCGAPLAAGDAALVAALARWREKDVAAFPSVLLAASGGRPCHATVELAHVRKPFLTLEDSCRWAGAIGGGRLTLRDGGAPALPRLLLSADDHGRLPTVAIDPARPGCSVSSVQSALLEGPTSEEHLRRLRGLGYLRDP
jgi:arylsulfatase